MKVFKQFATSVEISELESNEVNNRTAEYRA